MHLREKNEKLPESLKDIGRGEIKILLPACFLIIFIGLFPKLFIDRVSPTVTHILTMEKTLKADGDTSTEHH